MTITLSQWDVTADECNAYRALQPGDLVKVLYVMEDSGESNWCQIVEFAPNGFRVKPDPCLFLEVPDQMDIKYTEVKSFLKA